MVKGIIAVDFDGTCVVHQFPYVGPTLPNAVEVLRKLVDAGHLIVLDTMRDWVNKSPYDPNKSTMDDAVNWFTRNNIPLYSVQPHKHALKLFGSHSTKCHADISIDDRNLGCPLDGNGSVDWFKVEELLKERGYLE